MRDFFHKSGIIDKPSFKSWTCIDIYKWIKQALGSRNFKQDNITILTDLSSALCRSVYKDSNII
jgi:hypothetical protein